jgi:hypothetical protein
MIFVPRIEASARTFLLQENKEVVLKHWVQNNQDHYFTMEKIVQVGMLTAMSICNKWNEIYFR